MDTRRALLVDTFAADPTDGLPVAVVPDGATDEQLRAVASEFGTVATAPASADPAESLQTAGPDGPCHLPATVATVGHELARGEREPGTETVQTPAGERRIEATDDGRVWVEEETPAVERVEVEYADLGAALGIDPAALRDVGADLPPVRLSGAVDALAAPVNFLEHLGQAAPDRATLDALAETVGVGAICAFTFDTLAADAAAHARTFVTDGTQWPRTVGMEVPVTPALVGGCLTHLHGRGTVETATTVVEQGHFCDRPGRVHVDATSGLRVGGRTVTTLEGTVTLPPAEDDDIHVA